MIDYERGYRDGQVDRRAGLTYVVTSSEYERGYREGYADKCNSIRISYPKPYLLNVPGPVVGMDGVSTPFRCALGSMLGS